MSERIDYSRSNSMISSSYSGTSSAIEQINENAVPERPELDSPEPITQVRAFLLADFCNSALQDIDRLRYSIDFPVINHFQVKQSHSTIPVENNEDKEVDGKDTKMLVDYDSLIARDEVTGGFPDCGFTRDSTGAMAMNEYRQSFSVCESIEEKKVNRGSNEYVWNLLKKDDAGAYQEWKGKTAEERNNIYNGLDEVYKDMLDVASSGWIRREAVSNINAGIESSFNTFGSELNLIPKIGLEKDSMEKVKLGTQEYTRLMNSMNIKYDTGKAVKARMSNLLEWKGTSDYVRTIKNGGATCGEMSASLCNTYEGLFNSRKNEGRNNRIQAWIIQGTGDNGANHAATVIAINGKEYVSDPAWYAISNNGSLEGFGSRNSDACLLKPLDEWIKHWCNSKEFSHPMKQFYKNDYTKTNNGTEIYPNDRRQTVFAR